MRTDETREELLRLVHQRPFQQFVVSLENGDRLLVEHPENIAFDPEPNGRSRFYVITRNLSYCANLEAVTNFVHEDIGETVGA